MRNPAIVQGASRHFASAWLAPNVSRAEPRALTLGGSAIHRVTAAPAKHAGPATSLASSWLSERRSHALKSKRKIKTPSYGREQSRLHHSSNDINHAQERYI